jgi:hypothetical protein
MRLNGLRSPRQIYPGQHLRLFPQKLPITETSSISSLSYPLEALTITPSSMIRGQTAVMIVQTAIPVSCEVQYVDRVESCYTPDEGLTQVALLGFSPVLDPGKYPVELRIFWEAEELYVPLSLTLEAGRYDYERIDLPPGRQSLLDPERTQAERTAIAALRELRSAERLWEFPFQFPIEASVTSYYGSRRSYGYGFSSFHGGTDFRGKTGASVFAPASGIVILAEPLVVRGNAILIDHGWGIVTGYWHLSKIAVTVGQRVAQGERIGAVGNTGLSTGAHLHWELWVNGVAVSPLQWVTPFAELSE